VSRGEKGPRTKLVLNRSTLIQGVFEEKEDCQARRKMLAVVALRCGEIGGSFRHAGIGTATAVADPLNIVKDNSLKLSETI
jgi:hypothetical protein